MADRSPQYPEAISMRISIKLAASFLVMATLVGLVGFSSGRVQREVKRELEQLSRGAILNVVDAANMSDGLSATHLAVQEILFQQGRTPANAAADDAARRLMRRHRDTIETHLNAVRRSLERSQLAHQSLIRETEGRRQPEEIGEAKPSVLGQLSEAYGRYRAMMTELLSLMQEDFQAAESLFDDRLDPHFRDQLLPLIRELQENAEADFTRGVRGVERAMASATGRRNSITLASLAVALVLGLLVAWSVGRPLAKLTQATTQLAKGRLETRVDVRSRDEVGALAHAFNQMAASLQSKTVAKSYVDNIIRSMREMLIVTDRQLDIRQVNPAATRELGFAEHELTGQPLSRILDEPVDPASEDDGLAPQLYEARERLLRPNSKRPLPVWWTASRLQDEDGSVQGIVCVATNISDRKAAEQQLRASLREKEVLLKEVHHRVKNNLQIVSSLLNLQAQAAPTDEVARALRESQSRILSMSLIHEQLYRSDNLASIDFADYVRELTTHLARSVGAAARAIAVRVEVESVAVPIDLAVPCGMIVNELVTNAMEHAFPEGRAGEIRVGFRALDDRRELTVCDNGVGLTQSDDDAASGELGLKVVRALTQQIGGTLHMERDGGTRCTIEFGTSVQEAPCKAGS
jgi:PAS domain S-box-containing protein